MIRLITAIVLFGVLSQTQAAEHSPLMPRPAQIQYGSGYARVGGLGVRLPTEPSAEDWFTANTLSACLLDRSVSPIPISESYAAARVISLVRTGPVDALPIPDEQPGPKSREAYTLRVKPHGEWDDIEIRAASTAGLFYGAQTMCQLVEGYAAEAVLPEVEIMDWPSLAYRGTMVDMSHGPLPTVEEVKHQIDFLACWKANQYYLYSEASIQLDHYPLLNPVGRFSKNDIQRIISYGRERHIDVIPCLELYGHLHDLFRIEKYSELADTPHGEEFDPHNSKVMALLTDWVNQFAELFPSPFVHIGFEETFRIEIAARQSGAAANPANLFVEQLDNVAGLFKQHGKTVMAWGDITVRYPEIASELPPGLMAVAWEYDPGPEQHYEHRLGPLVAHHIPHMIAPGVTSWNQIAPDFVKSFDNIDTFLAAGRKSGALGIVNTIWTDDAQSLVRMSWPGMAYGAAAGWQSAPMDRKGFFSTFTYLDRTLVAPLRDPAIVAPEVAAALEDVARSEAELQKVLGDETMLALWGNPFIPSTLKKCAENREALRQTRLLAEDAEEHLDRAESLEGGDPAVLDSLLFASRLLDYAGQKFQTGPELDDLWRGMGPRRPKDELWWNDWGSQVICQDHSRLVDLMDGITELRKTYESEWLAEYTPYRLASALGRWDAEYQFWRQLQARFDVFCKSSHEGEPLPALDSLTQAK